MQKVIAVLGATGSVGTQALDVARNRGYRVDFITAGKNIVEAERLAREFSPRYLAMADEAAARDISVRLSDTDIKVFSGEAGIIEGINQTSATTVVNSILGEAGLMPTLATIDSGKRLALANKESLVIAGAIVKSRLSKTGGEIIPVDSEHSAIFQSLKSGKNSEIRRIILTASGGPFFGYTKEQLEKVTLSDTLAHPTWKMGKKITVDSATLMNKGFEIIEAVHLFDVPADRVEVVVHRESILHSAVEFVDSSMVGEFSLPDMRMCVQYAVDYPNREPAVTPPLDLTKIGALTFGCPDYEAFPLLALARKSMIDGGAMPAVINAADEVAVAAFLDGRISFAKIPAIVEAVYNKISYSAAVTDLDGIIAADREARNVASSLI